MAQQQGCEASIAGSVDHPPLATLQQVKLVWGQSALLAAKPEGRVFSCMPYMHSYKKAKERTACCWRAWVLVLLFKHTLCWPGPLPDAWRQLKAATNLYVNNNSLQGALPPSLFCHVRVCDPDVLLKHVSTMCCYTWLS